MQVVLSFCESNTHSIISVYQTSIKTSKHSQWKPNPIAKQSQPPRQIPSALHFHPQPHEPEIHRKDKHNSYIDFHKILRTHSFLCCPFRHQHTQTLAPRTGKAPPSSHGESIRQCMPTTHGKNMICLSFA